MTAFLTGQRLRRISRVLVTILLFLSLLGGAGVVAADEENASATNCPEKGTEEADKNANANAKSNSYDGRVRALSQTGCTGAG